MLRDYGAPKLRSGPRSGRLQHSDDRKHLDRTGIDEGGECCVYDRGLIVRRLRCLCSGADAVDCRRERKGKSVGFGAKTLFSFFFFFSNYLRDR